MTKPFIPEGGVAVVFRGRPYHLDWKFGKRVFTNSRGWESYYLEPEGQHPDFNFGVYSIDTNTRVGSFNCYMKNVRPYDPTEKCPYWHEPK